MSAGGLAGDIESPQANSSPQTPRWLFAWAMLTVLMTLPLVLLGAETTSMKAGMVDSRSVVAPWQAIIEVWEGNRGLGFLLEHTHRLAGWNIGLCAIGLVAFLWWKEPRLWVRWLGTLGLAFVIVQGLLGIFRIQLNALLGNWLALIHGGFAPIVVATLVSVAWVTSPSWLRTVSKPASVSLGRWSLVLVSVIWVQLILGGMVRHHNFTWSARVHVLGAFVVVAVAAKFLTLLHAEVRGWGKSDLVLVGLIGLQMVLGVETWLHKFYQPSQWSQLTPLRVESSFLRDMDAIRSIHYLAGVMIFSMAVSLAWSVCKGKA